MDFVAGSIIGGKYRVDRVVGEGGMGVVCVGTHLALGQRVAIKVLAAHVLGNEMAVARFEREARMSASLAHEHVVRVFDFGRTESGAPFLVMEFLEGEDLAARIERDGPLPVAEALELLAEACEGLAEAHARGLVHRDLKPSNLFLARRATGATVLKVIDFGIAKDAGALGSHAMTRSNDVMGSPQYMSPEQVRDAKNLDARTDVWSLGASFYEALAGVPVFEAESLTDLLVKIATAPVPSLRARRAEVPADVEAVLLRCLAREPEGRFASMGELLEAVRALTPTQRRSTFGRTSLAAAATVSASDGALEAARDAARAWKRRTKPFAVAGGFLIVALLAAAGGRMLARQKGAAYTDTSARPPLQAPDTAILDDVPITENPAARVAFLEGNRAYRDGDRSRFEAALRRAVEADPTLALAHLLLALETNAHDVTGARAHAALARTHRASLSRAAAALLEAAEAYVLPTADLASFEQRLQAARASFPTEPLVVEWLGMARQLRGFPTEAAETYVEAERLDPRGSRLPWRRGRALFLAGREPEALAVWSRCLEANPRAIGCREDRALLAFSAAGRCAEAEVDLRALMAEAPDAVRYPEALANALAARKSPVNLVVEVLAGRLALLPDEDRHAAQLDDQTSLALLDGDLESAIRFARARAALEHGPVAARVSPVIRLATLLDETGDRAGAAEVIEHFRSGGDAFGAALEESVAARALAAASPAEAEAAFVRDVRLASLSPRVGAVDLYARGRLGSLAGRSREARFFLERASGHCEALGTIERARARVLLAELDAAGGRTETACASLDAVVNELGRALPRSISADAARKAAARLRCGSRR